MLIEASFLVHEDSAHRFADALLEAGAVSVSVEDADADTPDEHPLYGEPGMPVAEGGWSNSRLVVLFQVEDDADFSPVLADLMLAVRDAGVDLPLPQRIQRVDDQDWVRLTQAQFEPIAIGRLWVVPSWHEIPEGAALTLRLDPGMAFGTGTHPTTRLCLEWLERHLEGGETVLDYGCGSGILAIAAAKLGASTITGVDIDPQAVIAAQDNARNNAVSGMFVDVADAVQGHFDIVLANILANPLRLLAPALVAHVAPRGSLVLSGILERQADELIAVYADAGMALEVAGTHEGWVCLAGRLRAPQMT